MYTPHTDIRTQVYVSFLSFVGIWGGKNGACAQSIILIPDLQSVTIIKICQSVMRICSQLSPSFFNAAL